MKIRLLMLLLGICPVLAALSKEEISLSGKWQLSLENPQQGKVQWQDISLPGTLDDAGIGAPALPTPQLDSHVLARLQRKVEYTGPAWYRKEVQIPDSWEKQSIVLKMERVLWKSSVWVDGQELGSRDSLSTPHRYDLGEYLAPGKHELLICIDNSEIHPGISRLAESFKGPGDQHLAHAYTNHTQIIWNGILGEISLSAEPVQSITSIQVFPRLAPTPAIKAIIKTHSALPAQGNIHLRLKSKEGAILSQVKKDISHNHANTPIEIDWELPGIAIDTWDEFTPENYLLEASLGNNADIFVTSFGFRELKAEDGNLLLNGNRILLRGTLECAIFPLTGYPPTDTANWKKIMLRAKEWGLNHLRFHSWCPPKAAFEAADECGLYLLVELPHWSHHVGENPETWKFLEEESARILAEYGNHPSFMFMSLGNELQGNMSLLLNLTRKLKADDPRRLYSVTSFSFAKGFGHTPASEDEFFITRRTRKGWMRGQGIFNTEPPSFEADYRNEIVDIKVPLITHEIGQYSVYPDMSEISKYTGTLVPVNFIAIRNDLEKKKLLHLSEKFTEATGRFAALLYKEEIERVLRTPGLDGFQLLGLQDFSGQGTALVGLLNAFWEPKGMFSAEEFREFCGPLVPLIRMPKATWNRGERISISFEIANFHKDIPAGTVYWTLIDSSGKEISKGSFDKQAIPSGQCTPIGKTEIPIPPQGKAEQWTITAGIQGSSFKNQWKLWVYPKDIPEAPSTVKLTDSLEDAIAMLSEGETVVLAPPIGQINGIEGRFLPVFWSPFHSPQKQSGTMGILCDPKHPALADFPTQPHADWQWWDISLQARSVILDDLPPLEPIVRMIDNFKRNHSLSLVLEAKVGKGKLIFCSVDISKNLENRPAARQLRRSLLSYAASPLFNPRAELDADHIRSFIRSDSDE